MPLRGTRVRLDLTASEALAITAYFEDEEKRKAREREVEAGKFKGSLVTEMDETGKADPAFEKLPEMDETSKVKPTFKRLRLTREQKIQRFEDAPLIGIKKVYLILEDDHQKRFRQWLELPNKGTWDHPNP